MSQFHDIELWTLIIPIFFSSKSQLILFDILSKLISDPVLSTTTLQSIVQCRSHGQLDKFLLVNFCYNLTKWRFANIDKRLND